MSKYLFPQFLQVGQNQGGLFGFMQKSLSNAQDHIWFERSEMKDRLTVAKRLVFLCL
jgi:glycerol-3-phosphate O-acyltransferase 3/4